MGCQDLDPRLLAPKRFVTPAHRNQVEQADGPALPESTGLSVPDLSKIIRDLEERGMVKVSKERQNRCGHTLVRLGEDGGKRSKQLLKIPNRTINP